MLFGYLGGLAACRAKSDLTHKRGTRIEDGTRLQRKRAATEGRGGQGPGKDTALTLAGIPDPADGRDQALQDDRHHRHRQVDGDPRTARGRTRPRRPRGDRRPRRRIPGALLRPKARRRDPQPLRPTRPHLEHLRRTDRQPRRRATRALADPRPRRRRQELARLRAHVLHGPCATDERRRQSGT